MSCRGVQPLGVSGPQWKKNSLGPHIKYISMRNCTKKSHNILSEFTILCGAAFTAILGCMWPAGLRLDTPDRAATPPGWQSLLGKDGMMGSPQGEGAHGNSKGVAQVSWPSEDAWHPKARRRGAGGASIKLLIQMEEPRTASRIPGTTGHI